MMKITGFTVFVTIIAWYDSANVACKLTLQWSAILLFLSAAAALPTFFFLVHCVRGVPPSTSPIISFIDPFILLLLRALFYLQYVQKNI